MKTFDPQSSGPLKDVRVLDLSRLVAGNMLSAYLADFGADVIKVEREGVALALAGPARRSAAAGKP